MTLAQSHAVCDFSNLHFRSKIRLSVLESPVGSPSRETTGQKLLVPERNSQQRVHRSEKDQTGLVTRGQIIGQDPRSCRRTPSSVMPHTLVQE
jgi:hypothetical protein